MCGLCHPIAIMIVIIHVMTIVVYVIPYYFHDYNHGWMIRWKHNTMIFLDVLMPIFLGLTYIVTNFPMWNMIFLKMDSITQNINELIFQFWMNFTKPTDIQAIMNFIITICQCPSLTYGLILYSHFMGSVQNFEACNFEGPWHLRSKNMDKILLFFLSI
jgi:hypothetical protein